MIGFIACLPIKVHIHGTDITLTEVDFFCEKKEFRSRRIVPVLIKEISSKKPYEKYVVGIIRYFTKKSSIFCFAII